MVRPKRRNWSRQHWLLVDRGMIEIERRQCVDEGKDISSLKGEFEALAHADFSDENVITRAEALMDAASQLPVRPDYGRCEPSDLEGIKRERPAAVSLPPMRLSEGQILEKALGGWTGRAAGCMLGKPVEGRRSWQIEKYLRAQNRWPLDRYFSLAAPPELARECGFDLSRRGLYEEGIECMVEDDDMNYTVTGLAIIEERGRDFRPEDVASFWLSNIPIFHVCTAERVAYKNLVDCIPPPESASFRNCYREWIGAQIRADFFGYVNPGNPERAAEFAWRDACISHVKNGIYGEMWVAAMLAAAYVLDEAEAVIRSGLAQIPKTSRLAENINRVIGMRRGGLAWEDALADFRSRWDENRAHDWCHAISNAEIVAMALLWGDGDFGRTISLAVMPGFDTDCNGATAGSVLGLMLGARGLPDCWTRPLGDTLLTGVTGYHKVSLTEMARKTADLIRKIGA